METFSHSSGGQKFKTKLLVEAHSLLSVKIPDQMLFKSCQLAVLSVFILVTDSGIPSAKRQPIYESVNRPHRCPDSRRVTDTILTPHQRV